MADRLAAELEIRASDSGPRIRATLIQEGRASTGSRRELFTPGAVQWAAEGVELRTEHLGKAETRAVPSREADGRIIIDAPATPALFAAVHAGKRFASVEFFALEERTTPTGVREVLRALVSGATVTDRPEYDSTSAELRERRSDLERKARVWL